MPLNMQTVMAACKAINLSMLNKFKKHPKVTQFYSRLPDEQFMDVKRRLFTEDPSRVTVTAGQPLWGIDMADAFGKTYYDDLPKMGVADWEDLFDFLFGFVDFEPVFNRHMRNAEQRRQDRLANPERGKHAGEMRYNESEKFCREMYDKRAEFNAGVMKHMPTISAAFKKLSLCNSE